MRSLLIVAAIHALTVHQDLSAEDLPKIHFDVSAVISCCEVTTEAFARNHSHDKLLEVRLKTSALVEKGSDRLIRELFFFVESPGQSIRIIECFPKTMMLTEYAAPIDVSENRENSNNASLNFSPVLELGGKANFNAGLSDRKGETRRTAKLPPKQLAIASGTQNRQNAAYFKLKSSSQSTLEGTRELRLIIQVPNTWRADLLHVRCSGWTGVANQSQVKLSRSDFMVPMYTSGDTTAKITCDQFVSAETQLRRESRVAVGSNNNRKKDLVSRVALFVRRDLFKQGGKTPSPAKGVSQLILGTRSLEELIQADEFKFDAQTLNAMRVFHRCRVDLMALNR